MEFVNCTIDPLACNCRPADNTVSCLCAQISDEKQVFKMTNSLPFDHNGILIKVVQGEIVAMPELSAAEIQLKMNGVKMKTKIELNTCKVEANLTGCFDCQRGAHVKLQCRTDFGQALASIVCPSAKMAIPCGPRSITKTLAMHFSSSSIDENCDVFCGASPTRFRLKGVLTVPEAILDTDLWKAAAGSQAATWWNFELPKFDVLHLLEMLLLPRHFFTWIFAIFLTFLILYCLTPFLLRFFLSRIVNFFFVGSVVTHPKLPTKSI